MKQDRVLYIIICLILFILIIVGTVDIFINLRYYDYGTDCKETEIFLEQSFITGVGECVESEVISFCEEVKSCEEKN